MQLTKLLLSTHAMGGKLQRKFPISYPRPLISHLSSLVESNDRFDLGFESVHSQPRNVTVCEKKRRRRKFQAYFMLLTSFQSIAVAERKLSFLNFLPIIVCRNPSELFAHLCSCQCAKSSACSMWSRLHCRSERGDMFIVDRCTAWTVLHF